MVIGEVSDAAKRDEALEIRRLSHRDQPKLSPEELDHLYLPKSMFEGLAAELGYGLAIVDHTTLNMPTYQAARYRYTAYFKDKQA